MYRIRHTQLWHVQPVLASMLHLTVMLKSCMSCRKMGLNSLPVAFGPEVAKWITVATIDVTQIAVAAYLAIGRHETTYAAVLTALILPQVDVHLTDCRSWCSGTGRLHRL